MTPDIAAELREIATNLSSLSWELNNGYLSKLADEIEAIVDNSIIDEDDLK